MSHGRSTNAPAPADPYRWDKRAVSLILERREYTGCTVNFKTYTNYIWDKKRHLNPVENQAIFPDTHERIIDDDVFEKVQVLQSGNFFKTWNLDIVNVPLTIDKLDSPSISCNLLFPVDVKASDAI